MAVVLVSLMAPLGWLEASVATVLGALGLGPAGCNDTSLWHMIDSPRYTHTTGDRKQQTSRVGPSLTDANEKMVSREYIYLRHKTGK